MDVTETLMMMILGTIFPRKLMNITAVVNLQNLIFDKKVNENITRILRVILCLMNTLSSQESKETEGNQWQDYQPLSKI